MVMDRGFQDVSGVDGLSYEDLFSYQSPMDGGGFKMNFPQASFVTNNFFHGSDSDASPSLVVQNSLPDRKSGAVQPYSNSSCYFIPSMSKSDSIVNGNPTSTSSTSHEVDSSEDCEVFSDIALGYISRMLMEEDVDEKINLLYHEKEALQATEKPFYDILGQQYPPPSPYQPSSNQTYPSESPKDNSSNRRVSSGGSSSSGLVNPNWVHDSSNNNQSGLPSVPMKYLNFRPSIGGGSAVNPLVVPGLRIESQPAWQFKRGMEEGQKFLPSENNVLIVADDHVLRLKQEEKSVPVQVREYEPEKQQAVSVYGSRGRKEPQIEDLDLKEGRSIKQSALSSEEVIRSEMFDEVLLCHGAKKSGLYKMNDLREAIQNGAASNTQNGQNKGSTGRRKGRGKKHQKKDVVDLRTLLIHCAQAVAADDRRTASELLKQIRQSASSFGDGTQRLAHCFANGLEARLAGTGSQIYKSLVAQRTTATDILKAYQLYLAACPFKKISHFFSNQTILNVSEKASKVHIIDFGIYFGFQWPCLIQCLSKRPGGPPKLRITGVDVPQPGFRPTERVEETGKRLANYAKSFNVPFKYNAIASKWETITVEDLKIDEEEVLIVNCLYRFRNLVDETVVVDSPRNKVLRTIRKANPNVFIHGILNGSYSVPFFITRFREALFHFSALFDMLETTVPRDDAQRLLIERDLFGREALNVISCEGSERVERPETYKQWQVRNLKAGFTQLPLDPEIMKKAVDKVKVRYHKDFMIDEDNRWLIQGWKGRIIYAASTWKPQ